MVAVPRWGPLLETVSAELRENIARIKRDWQFLSPEDSNHLCQRYSVWEINDGTLAASLELCKEVIACQEYTQRRLFTEIDASCPGTLGSVHSVRHLLSHRFVGLFTSQFHGPQSHLIHPIGQVIDLDAADAGSWELPVTSIHEIAQVIFTLRVAEQIPSANLWRLSEKAAEYNMPELLLNLLPHTIKSQPEEEKTPLCYLGRILGFAVLHSNERMIEAVMQLDCFHHVNISFACECAVDNDNGDLLAQLVKLANFHHVILEDRIEMFRESIRGGHMRVLKVLQDSGFLAQIGSVQCADACSHAVNVRNLTVLEFLKNSGCLAKVRSIALGGIFAEVAYAGDIELLYFFRDSGRFKDISGSLLEHVLAIIAQDGNVATVQFLRNSGCFSRISQASLVSASMQARAHDHSAIVEILAPYILK